MTPMALLKSYLDDIIRIRPVRQLLHRYTISTLSQPKYFFNWDIKAISEFQSQF
jgi:hypothetical protein